jgi:hypothetical protein
MTPRRTFLHLAAGACALSAVSRGVWAQAYPTRPVRWIVGFTPAGGNDIVARLMGQWLSERLGQPFVVENRPGAGTNIAAEAVVNAPPDGYTLFLANISNAINATLYEKLNFNFIRDIALVAGISRAPLIMAVNLSVPARTVPEFIAHAKANPGKVNMASAGIGSAGHLAGELFIAESLLAASSSRRAAVLRSSHRTRPEQSVFCVSGAAVEHKVGGLLQAPIRWAAGSAALPRPLHPPRRHLKSPLDRMQRERRHIQVEGLQDRRSRPLQGDDPRHA